MLKQEYTVLIKYSKKKPLLNFFYQVKPNLNRRIGTKKETPFQTIKFEIRMALRSSDLRAGDENGGYINRLQDKRRQISNNSTIRSAIPAPHLKHLRRYFGTK